MGLEQIRLGLRRNSEVRRGRKAERLSYWGAKEMEKIDELVNFFVLPPLWNYLDRQIANPRLETSL